MQITLHFVKRNDSVPLLNEPFKPTFDPLEKENGPEYIFRRMEVQL